MEDTSAFKGNKVCSQQPVLITAERVDMCATIDNPCPGCGVACSAICICGHMHVRIFPLEVQWQVINTIEVQFRARLLFFFEWW
jgi:hypothetical protein